MNAAFRLICVMILAVSFAGHLCAQDFVLFPRPDSARIAADYRFYGPIADSTLLIYPDSIITAPDEILPYDEIEFDEWGFPVVTNYYRTLPDASFGIPVIVDGYEFLDSLQMLPGNRGSMLPDETSVYGWIDEINFSDQMLRHARRNFISNSPGMVRYNIDMLPEPPKHYHAFVDPVTSRIVIAEDLPQVDASQATALEREIKRVNWLTTFNASLQFSQAYVSPNWYQGGNNNINMLANIYYNIKLNEAFHKNVLFDVTAQYKLGFNNAPEDTVRSYNITDDLLQITGKFGLKAAKRWYYSLQTVFKTQILNSYPSNSHTLRSAFLSPGEFNLGIGMTYNYTNPKKTVTFNTSISPLSYNLKTCVNRDIDPVTFGIKEGHKTVSQYGSSAECTFLWKISYNITYKSRLFGFTDYDYIQADWEHTLTFDINRFMSTQIYAHMRYDSSTAHNPDSNWQKFQFKELFSLGFSYKFSTK